MDKNRSFLDDYQIVETEDGSYSIYSGPYDELCHSKAGASSETQFQYLEGCQIFHKAQGLSLIRILEVGFGAGIGALETATLLKDVDTEVIFTSLEIDSRLVDYFLEKNSFKFQKNLSSYEIDLAKNFKLIVLIGDAREEIAKLQNFQDAIYQDAFSPKKNSSLWTLEWFKDLYKLSNDETILSTYCSSSSVRKTMHKAGWSLYEGGGFKMKRSSTRARKSGNTSEEILLKLRSEKISVLTDEALKP